MKQPTISVDLCMLLTSHILFSCTTCHHVPPPTAICHRVCGNDPGFRRVVKAEVMGVAKQKMHQSDTTINRSRS